MFSLGRDTFKIKISSISIELIEQLHLQNNLLDDCYKWKKRRIIEVIIIIEIKTMRM